METVTRNKKNKRKKKKKHQHLYGNYGEFIWTIIKETIATMKHDETYRWNNIDRTLFLHSLSLYPSHLELFYWSNFEQENCIIRMNAAAMEWNRLSAKQHFIRLVKLNK